MSRTFRVLFVGLTVCACDPPANPTASAPEKTAKAEPAKTQPAKSQPAKDEPTKAEPATDEAENAEPAKGDPVLLKVCKAFDDVSAENKPEQDHLLAQRTAARAVELGLTEAQIEALGPQPPQLLASIRARGNPPQCAAFVAYLEKLP